MTGCEDYPASWYAATRNIETSYPSLSGEVQADVCIIGAGFSGLSTAIYLAEKGVDVVLLEANRAGWGASGRNGGQLVRGYGEDTQNKIASIIGDEAGKRAGHLGFVCLDLVRDMIDRYGIECDLASGYARLAITPRQVRYLRATYESWERNGVPGNNRFVEKKDLHDLVGSDYYAVGLYTDAEGQLHPLNLALGEARAFIGLGGRFHECSAATDISYDRNGGPVQVTTAHGRVSANHLVLCGNAYLRKLEPKLMPPLIPGYSGIIATEPLGEEAAKRIMPLQFAGGDMRTVLDYYRMTPDHRLLWGGLAHWSGDDTPDPRPLLHKRMLRVFPWLADKAIDYAWTGRIGISANLEPQIGKLAPNVYYAQAYSGHGVGSCHLSGRMIADEITGGSDDFKMFARVKHLRLPPYAWVGKLARLWGMNSKRVIEWF